MSVGPLLICGPHRSGTSITALVLADLGIHLGDELLAPAPPAPAGYGEDVTIKERQDRLLSSACGDSDVPAWPGWGWRLDGAVDRQVLDAGFPALVAWAEERRGAAGGGPWGWKDPRTTMLATRWASALPDARFLICHRPPAEVVASMERLRFAAPVRDHLLAIWVAYARELVTLLRTEPDRCCVVDGVVAAEAPWCLAEVVEDLLGAPLPGLAAVDPRDRIARAWVARARWCNPGLLDRDPGPLEGPRGLVEEALDLDVRLREATGWWRPDRRTPVPLADLVPDAVPSATVVAAIPTHDDADPYLLDALASVRCCRSEQIGVVVVDDCTSEPASVALLAAVEACGVPVVRTTSAGTGPSHARNVGLAAADSPYVLALDVDNLVRPGFVPLARERLDAEPDLGAVYPDGWFFGDRTGPRPQPEIDLDEMVVFNQVDQFALLRTSAVVDAGGWRPDVSCYQDWDLWLAMLEAGWRLERAPVVGFDYRIRLGSQLRGLTLDDHRAMVELVVGRHEGLLAGRGGRVVARLELAIRRLEERAAHAEAAAADADRRREAAVGRLRAEVATLRDEVAGLRASRSIRLAAAIRRWLRRPPPTGGQSRRAGP